MKTPHAYGLYKITGPPIGNGAYGYVFPSKNPAYDFDVAIKMVETLSNNKFRYSFVKSALREIAIANYVNKVTRYVLPKYCKVALWNKRYIGIPFRKMQCSLQQYCNRNDISDETLITIMFKTLHCLQTLHSVRIVHNDIKADNIVVNYDDRRNITDLRLCDLGLAYVQEESNVPNCDVLQAAKMFQKIANTENEEIHTFISLLKTQNISTMLENSLFDHICVGFTPQISRLKGDIYKCKELLLDNLKMIDQTVSINDLSTVLANLYEN